MGLLTADIKEFVNTRKLGFVATVCPDGSPNLSPKGTTIAWDDDHLAFADIHSPGTVDNLQTNPSIEINVVDVFIRKGYRFKGVAQVFSEGPIFEEVLGAYRAAGAEHTVKNIVLVRVQRVQPLYSPAYDTGASEEEIRNRWIEYWGRMYGW